jgi:gamma-glutamylcyclotransferase (GGCT)/AIG2-like uncharacterized protein YtfP
MTSDPGYLFTYGTLMQGFDNPFAEKLHTLLDLRRQGLFQWSTCTRITWYPGRFTTKKSDYKVYGEIYRLAAGHLN